MSEALGMLGFGVLMLVVGGVLVTDFRGAASWHTRRSLDFARPFIVWRRRETPEQRADRIALALIVMRIVGGIFSAAGALLMVAGVGQLLISAA